MVYLLVIALSLLPFSNGLPKIELGIITFDFYMFALLFVLVISLFQSGAMIRRYRAGSTDYAIIALGIAYLVSTLNSPDILEAGYLAFHGLFLPFVSFYVIKSILVNEKSFRTVFYGFLVAILVFGVAELVVLLQTMERPMAFNVPAISGATLLIVPALFYLFYPKIKKSIRYSALVLSMLAMLSTLARVYILYIVIAGLIHKRVKRGQGLLLTVLLIVGTLLVTLLLIEFSALLGEHQGVNQEGKRGLERLLNLDYWVYALQGRTYSFLEGLANFKNNILFGTGLYRGEINVTRHNFHIQWLEYGGLVGYVLYAAVFISHLSRVSKAACSDTYIAINITILLGILLNGFTNGFMHGLMPHIVFIIMGFSEARLIINHNLESVDEKEVHLVGSDVSVNSAASSRGVLPKQQVSILRKKEKNK